MRLAILGLLAASTVISVPASAGVVLRGSRSAAIANQFGLSATAIGGHHLRGLRLRGGGSSGLLFGGGRGGRLLERGVTTNVTGFTVNSLTAAAVQGGVPEPSTWAMMLLGFGAVGFGLRRRKRGMSQLA